MHFFLPVRQEKDHGKRSEAIASAFCNAFERQFCATTSVVGVEVDHLDAVVLINGEATALEFAGYHQRDEYLEDECADSQVKGSISRTLSTTDLPRYQIRVRWRTEQRRSRKPGQSPERAKVPHNNGMESFVQEFVRLAERVSQDPNLLSRPIRFRRGGRLPVGSSRYAAVDESEFPRLREYCRLVEFQPWCLPSAPTISTSTDARHLGFDRGQLRRVVNAKLAKIDEYRKRARGRPVWLVVHSDGYPVSAHLHECERASVIDMIAALASNAAWSFGEIWWAEQTASPNAARIFRVR